MNDKGPSPSATAHGAKKPVAVIILNWNGSSLLRRYLPSVVENTPADIADVIVADNGSTDDSRHVLATEFPKVKTLLFDTNHGFAEGYNLAITSTRYTYTVLLNSDVRTPAHWLEPLFRHMESHPQTAAVQPKIRHDRDDGIVMMEYAGAAGGFLDKHGFPYCRGRIFGTVEPDEGQYDTPPLPVMWASGACLMVRTKDYLSLGGLDPHFFAHMEEIDLCWRMRLAGHEVEAVTDSHIYHLGGGSLPQGNARKTYLNFRNNLLLLYKNLPRTDRRKTLFVRRLYDTLAMFQSLAALRWADAKAILKAHRDFRKMKEHYDGQGAQAMTQATTNLLKTFPGASRNIIIDYYLLRRTTFDKLK